SPHAPEAATLLTQRGVPAFTAAESVTAALAGMLQASQWKAPAAEGVAAARVETGDLPTGSLDEAEAKQLFARFGVPCAREVILGMHRDPLGTAILLGMGGVTAELLKDTTMRLLPPQGGLGREEALSMARELKTWPLLDGFRGRPKADVQALVDAIVAFSQMAA